MEDVKPLGGRRKGVLRQIQKATADAARPQTYLLGTKDLSERWGTPVSTVISMEELFGLRATPGRRVWRTETILEFEKETLPKLLEN